MIEEDYVSFETAKLLKDNGFDEKVVSFYPPGNIQRPTLQMAMKWLREWYYLYIILDFERPNCIEYKIYEFDDEELKRCLLHYDYEESYEEAYEEAIKYCLENLIK